MRVLALFVLLTFSAFGAPLCIDVYRGKPAIPPKELGLPPEAKAFLLGEGEKGGPVYRIVYPDGSTAIRKFYKTGPSGLRNDLERFKILRDTLAGAEGGFQIPNAHAVGESAMEIDDIEGEELEDLLSRLDPSSDEYKALESRYSKSLKQLIERIEVRNTEVKVSAGNYITFKDAEGHTWFIYLHKRNIVVTANGDLVVVDPY